MNGANISSNYDDIISLPHHVSTERRRMSNRDRAAQFAPFAALTGYEDYIREEARLTQSRPETGEDAADELNLRLTAIAGADEAPEVEVVYFAPDVRKSGGAYVCVRGYAEDVDIYARLLLMRDGTTIPIDRICSIDGDIFDLD